MSFKKADILNLLALYVFLSLTGNLCAQDTQVEMEDMLEKADIDGLSKIFVIVSPLSGFPEMQSYQSLNYATEIRKIEDGRVEIINTLANQMPNPKDAFPLRNIPNSLDKRYLSPSPKIESKDPRIQSLAEEILTRLDDPNTKDVVYEVLRWNRGHLFWGNPNEVPSAIESFENQTVNCIGFTHLPAAILRHLGIPARTVRTFIARPDQNRLIPHYLLEVYFPSLEGWITYEPQGPGMPFIENIVLYTHHDWDVEGQKIFRPLSRDMNITVSGGVDASIPNPDLSPPELISLDFSPSHFDRDQGHEQVLVTLNARDLESGVDEIRIDMQAPDFSGPGKSLFFHLKDGDEFEGTFTAQLGWNMQTANHAREYRVSRMRMSDNLGNVREYQAKHLEEKGFPTGVTLETWTALDDAPPEPVYISPFFPERVPAAPNGLHYTFFYTVSKTSSNAEGGISTTTDFVHNEGVQVRASSTGSFRSGQYFIGFHYPQYVPPHHPYGKYQMNSYYLRGPNDRQFNILPRNFNQELMNYSFELVKDVPMYSGPVEIESIIIFSQKDGQLSSNQDMVLIQTSGAISPLNEKPQETDQSFRMFFETMDGKKVNNRRSVCSRRFGSHHLLFRSNGPRDTPVRIERIELDDKEGNTHVFYMKDLQNKILKTIPEYMVLD
ncbi:transglutaminase-like domain-containing protein [Indibacter alkaliphilus]|uniref:transglutaminase-like domain-containing protein n=1 Tax=Indibacter alkaliphilus TaxID=579922 RepID=UPI00028232E0|nr:transglutaminase family protein [Indibacter alkaliphilus]